MADFDWMEGLPPPDKKTNEKMRQVDKYAAEELRKWVDEQFDDADKTVVIRVRKRSFIERLKTFFLHVGRVHTGGRRRR